MEIQKNKSMDYNSLPEDIFLLLKNLNKIIESDKGGKGSSSVKRAKKQIILEIKKIYNQEFRLSEFKKDKKMEWERIREEMFSPEFKNDEEKKVFLDKCFNGERKFPWHLQGQSIKVIAAEAAIAAIESGGIPILGGSLSGREEYDALDLKGMNRDKRREIGHDLNEKTLLAEVEKVRAVYPHAILGVNILHAVGDFERLVIALGKQGLVDILYVGAGLPLNMSTIMEDYPDMRYMGIVSSGVAVGILETRGDGTERPDGYPYEDEIAAGHNAPLKKLRPGRKKLNKNDHISGMKKFANNKPIIYTGGVYHQKDVKKAVMPEVFGGRNTNGFGIGTRGLLTKESGVADSRLESIHLNTNIPVVRHENLSPTGLPCTGKTNPDFFKEIKKKSIIKLMLRRCNDCLNGNCIFWNSVGEKSFCIATSLVEELKGGDYGMSFMSDIDVNDPLYKKGVPTMKKMIKYVVDGDL